MKLIKLIYYPHLLCHCYHGHGVGHDVGVGHGHGVDVGHGVGVFHGHGGGHCHVGSAAHYRETSNKTACGYGPGKAYKRNDKSAMTIALNDISN